MARGCHQGKVVSNYHEWDWDEEEEEWFCQRCGKMKTAADWLKGGEK